MFRVNGCQYLLWVLVFNKTPGRIAIWGVGGGGGDIGTFMFQLTNAYFLISLQAENLLLDQNLNIKIAGKKC